MLNFPQTPELNQTISYQNFVYQWNGDKWLVLLPPEATAVPVFVSEIAPQLPLSDGALWFKPTTAKLNVWAPRPSGLEWSEVYDSPDKTPFIKVSEAAPPNPESGDLWYDPMSRTLRSWAPYVDSGVWMTLVQNPSTNYPPAVVVVSESSPAYPVMGMLWYKPSTITLSVWLNVGGSPTWQILSSPELFKASIVFISVVAPLSPKQGDLWWNPSTQEFRVWNDTLILPIWELVAKGGPVQSVSILTGFGGSVSMTSPTYFNFGGMAYAAESALAIALPTPGTLSDLRIKLSSSAVVDYTFTVRKNLENTPLKLSISGSDSRGSNSVNSVLFDKGDKFSIKADPVGFYPMGDLDVWWTAKFTTS